MRTTIGGVEVDLPEEALPEFSYSILDTIDPSKFRGSSSTTFEIPATNATRRALGGPSLAEATAPEQEFRIGRGGQTLFDGIAVPVEWTEDSVSVVVFGDNAEWINAAKNTKCSDVDLGFSQYVENGMMEDSWTDDGRADVYPLIDYGGLVNHTPTTNTLEGSFYPAVRVWRILDKFFSDQGFTVAPFGAFAALWKRLILPYAGGRIEADPSQYSGRLRLEAATTMGPNPGGLDQGFVFCPPWDNEDLDPAGYADPSGAVYQFWEPAITATWRVRLRCDLTVTSAPGARILFQVRVNSRLSGSDGIINDRVFERFATSTVQTFSFDEVLFDVLLEDGVQYYLSIIPFVIPFAAGDGTVTIESGALLDWTLVNLSGWQADIIYNIGRSIHRSLTVIDLINALANIFRLAIHTDQLTNKVTMGHLDDYLKDISEGDNWTDRVDTMDRPRKVLPERPRNYSLNYELDASDFYLVDFRRRYGRELGEGIYDVGGRDKDNEIKVVFAPTAEGVRYGGLKIPIVRDNDSAAVADSTEIKPRILIFDGLAEGAWRFDGVDRTTFPRSHFVGAFDGDLSLSFGNEFGRVGTLDRHWKTFLMRATRPYFKGFVRLYDDEFMNFSFDRPRLINDGHMNVWVYVQKIEGKRFGDSAPVECELIPV